MTDENKELSAVDLEGDFKKAKQEVEGIGKDASKKVFNGILEYYDINFEDIVNDQGKDGAKTLQNKFIRAIEDGRIETNTSADPKEGFQIIQNTRDGKTITYNEYNATAAEESDKGKGVSASQYNLLGSLCGKPKSVRALRGPDLKLAEYVAILFLL